MTGWLVLAVYVAGFLFTYRHAYLALVRNEEKSLYARKPDAEDRAMMAVMGMLAASMWPITIIGWALWRFVTPTTPGERKAELDAREREIGRLERELGIERDA